MADLNSDKALVCRKEVVTEAGPGTIWHVLLSDGHLIDCGTGYTAERRALTLATMINEVGPERLSQSALQQGERS